MAHNHLKTGNNRTLISHGIQIQRKYTPEYLDLKLVFYENGKARNLQNQRGNDAPHNYHKACENVLKKCGKNW